MLRNFTSSVLNAITASLSPQVTTSNTLNPVHLALATRGYWIQSHILHIPDQYGFFSPSPPRLQVYQGFLFIAMLIMTISSIFCGASVIFLLSLRPGHKLIWRVVVFMAVPVVGTLAMIWIMECFGKRRTPDYDWGDWKLRKD
jgi:hypothetical protein